MQSAGGPLRSALQSSYSSRFDDRISLNVSLDAFDKNRGDVSHLGVRQSHISLLLCKLYASVYKYISVYIYIYIKESTTRPANTSAALVCGPFAWPIAQQPRPGLPLQRSRCYEFRRAPPIRGINAKTPSDSSIVFLVTYRKISFHLTAREILRRRCIDLVRKPILIRAIAIYRSTLEIKS